jgi:cytoskeletal protein CcmA (bactofilin family)
MKESEFKKLNFSILGKQSSMEGTFNFSGDTLLNCHITGDLTMIGEGKLTLERSCRFDGNIFCHDIEVFGEISGSINAAGTLSARSGSSVSGVINAEKISISPGAIINMEAHTKDEDNHLTN